jgi:hypothetical protein
MFISNPFGIEGMGSGGSVPFGYSSFGYHPGSGEFGADPDALSQTTREQWEMVPGHREWDLPGSLYTELTGRTDFRREKLLSRPDLLAQNSRPRSKYYQYYSVAEDRVIDLPRPDFTEEVDLTYAEEVTVIAPRDDPPPPLTFAETWAADAPVRILRETVISVERVVSDPVELKAAEGRGWIELGDVKAFLKGAVNGLVNLVGDNWAGLNTAILNKSLLGVPNLKLPNFEIDPNYGGAGIFGEHLATNLALEGLSAAPELESALRKALASKGLAAAVRAPVFWFMGAGGVGGGIPRSASAVVDVAEVTASASIESVLPALKPELEGALPSASSETSFANLIDNSEFSSHPAIIARLSRARLFDVGGYKSLTAKGEYGRPWDGLDSDEALQNAFGRYRKDISRHNPLLAGNPSTALTPELHRQIGNLTFSQFQGRSAADVLRFHIDQMRGFTPDFVLVVLERESLKFIELLGL